MQKTKDSPISIYEIRIQGKLDERWSSWFNGTTISTVQIEDNPAITRLICQVSDQAKLRGILNKIWDLNLILISVNQLENTKLPTEHINMQKNQ